MRYASVATNESGFEVPRTPPTGGGGRMEKDYGPLSRDSKVDVSGTPSQLSVTVRP